MTLRIRGDSLDPDDITRLLGAGSDVAAKLGETWHTPKGKAVRATTGFWHLGGEDRSPGDLDTQILALLSSLSQDLAVWEDLASHFRVELFCGMMMARGNEGTGLRAETVRAMAQRGLHFELDIYAPPNVGEDEEENREPDTVAAPGASGA